MGVAVSSSHVSAAPSSSRSAPASAWGPSHGTHSSMNFSSVSPSHGVLFFMNCCSVGPFHGVQSFRSTLFQHGSPMGSQALPANPIQRVLLSPVICRSWQAPHGVTASFRPPPAPAWGPFQGLHMDTCSSMDLHGLQQDHLPHHGLHHALQGKTLCSSVSSTSSPSFFTDLGVCRVVSLT